MFGSTKDRSFPREGHPRRTRPEAHVAYSFLSALTTETKPHRQSSVAHCGTCRLYQTPYPSFRSTLAYVRFSPESSATPPFPAIPPLIQNAVHLPYPLKGDTNTL